MQRESFIFYRSFYNCLKNLPIEERDVLSMAILGYALDGVEPNLDGVLVPMFELIRPQIDANNKRFVDGQKGGAPKGNKNAKKEREKTELASDLGNQYKTTTGGIENNQWLNEKQPNVNDNVNVNVNVNENENVSSTLDADASRKNVAKKNVYEEEVEALRTRLTGELNVEVINKIIEFDKVKKGKKIRKYAEAQVKAFLTTLNSRPTDKEKIDMLNTCIGNDYQGIYRNNRAQPVKTDRPSGNLFH